MGNDSAPAVQQSAPAPSSSDEPAARSSPTPEPVTDPSEPSTGDGKTGKARSKKGAVDAAAKSMDILAAAQFLPPNLMLGEVKKVATPQKVSEFERSYAIDGERLASILGYEGIADALANSEYNIRTEQYRVDRYSSTRAVVSLFTVTHWVEKELTRQNLVRYRRVDALRVDVVEMRWQNNKWLYVDTTEPLEGQPPTPDPNSSLNPDTRLENAITQFKTHLKGYKDYVQTH
jgi:hypothetical protein